MHLHNNELLQDVVRGIIRGAAKLQPPAIQVMKGIAVSKLKGRKCTVVHTWANGASKPRESSGIATSEFRRPAQYPCVGKKSNSQIDMRQRNEKGTRKRGFEERVDAVC